MNKFIIFVYLFLYTQYLSSQERLRSMYDGERRVYYLDVADAERKLIDIIKNESDDYEKFPSKLFTDLVVSDERCIDFGFDKLVDASEKLIKLPFSTPLRILRSEDGCIRLYSWDFSGGSMTQYSGITSVKQNGVLTSYAYLEDEASEGDLQSEQGGIACGATDIKVFQLKSGDKIYVVNSSYRVDSRIGGIGFSSYEISDGKMKPYALFEGKTLIDAVLNSEYDWVFTDKYLDIPESYDDKCSDFPLNSGRYLRYNFDGEQFRFSKIVYSAKLNKRLYGFKKNLIDLDISPWRFRVDEMPDGSYRYASWRNKPVLEEPDLVVENGKCLSRYLNDKKNKEEKKWIFCNDGYFYEVCCIYENSRLSYKPGAKKVVVKKGSRILMTLTE